MTGERARMLYVCLMDEVNPKLLTLKARYWLDLTMQSLQMQLLLLGMIKVGLSMLHMRLTTDIKAQKQQSA